MNKRIFYNSRFHRLDGRVFLDGECIDKPADTKEANSQLLDYIFCCDPVTGLPKGDIASFLGEKTNAEVKNFIELNLLKDNVNERGQLSLSNDILNKMRGTINDDDIAFFSRNDGEDSESYANRLHNYFENERYKNALRKQTNQLKKMIEGSVKDKDKKEVSD